MALNEARAANDDELPEAAAARGDAAGRAADLRVRADRPRGGWRRRCAARGTANLDDIRRSLRLGMGPCQGGFCIYRATGILHGVGRLDGAQASESLRRFLQERWKGVWPILYGDQLRQARLDDWIFQGLLDVEHAAGATRRMSHDDVVVIGIGLAGLTAAVRLAEGGARVLVLAKGVGATHLGPCTIDVLGYAPERVERPGEALAGLPASRPPVRARSARDGVAAAIEWFKAESSARRYVGGAGREPAAADRGRRAEAVGRRAGDDGGGDLRGGGEVCVVGLPRRSRTSMRRCWPTTSRARAVRGARRWSSTSCRSGAPTSNALGFARAFDDPAFRAQVVGAAERRGSRAERAASAFPAVLGVAAPQGVARAAGPARPPGVRGADAAAVGARACACSPMLRERLRRAGGRRDPQRVGHGRRARRRARDRACAADVGLREVTHGADWVVLATGGFACRRDRARLALAGARDGARAAGRRACRSRRALPARVLRRAADRARGRGGRRASCARSTRRRGVENVLVAGATLAGAEPWKEKSGDGHQPGDRPPRGGADPGRDAAASRQGG